MTDFFEAHSPGLATEQRRKTPAGALGQVFNFVLSRGERGATHFEVNAAFGWHDAQSSRPLSSLVKAEQLVRLEETRPGLNGNEAHVHVHPLFAKQRPVARKAPRAAR